jgi:hypothetical protein
VYLDEETDVDRKQPDIHGEANRNTRMSANFLCECIKNALGTDGLAQFQRHIAKCRNIAAMQIVPPLALISSISYISFTSSVNPNPRSKLNFAVMNSIGVCRAMQFVYYREGD